MFQFALGKIVLCLAVLIGYSSPLTERSHVVSDERKTSVPTSQSPQSRQLLLEQLGRLLSNVSGTASRSSQPPGDQQPPADAIHNAVQLFNRLLQSSSGRHSASGRGADTMDGAANLLPAPVNGRQVQIGLVVLAYSLIVLVSVFGNALVCHVVASNRRLHVVVTNVFIANLAVSDLLMTCLNIPFSVSRVLLDDWPFGRLMCSIVPFVQVCSVHVSAFTMVAIALDRYRAIVHPLRPRLSTRQGLAVVVLVWLLAAAVSLPHALYNRLVAVFTLRRLVRCQSRFPSPARQFRKWLTLATCVSQYSVPLLITGLAYLAISRRVWRRAVLGVSTESQLRQQSRSKRKTIKMLIVVVVLFAICWLPLNLYHLVVDFSNTVGPGRHNSTLFFMCHWLAMSNVCYNPFIYCWLNEHFRAGALSWFRWVARRSSTVYPAIEIQGVLVRTSRRCPDQHDSSFNFNTMSSSYHCGSMRPGKRSSSNREDLTLSGYLEVRNPEMLTALFSSAQTRSAAIPDSSAVAATSQQVAAGEIGFPLMPLLGETSSAETNNAFDLLCQNISIVYKKDEQIKDNRALSKMASLSRNTSRHRSFRTSTPADRVSISIYGEQEGMAELEEAEGTTNVRLYKASISGFVREVCRSSKRKHTSNDDIDRIQETSFQNCEPPDNEQYARRKSTVSRNSV